MEENMAEKTTTSEDVPQFPINQQLLEESTKIKEEWRVVRDRLEKIEASREQVTPAVYERVKSDYQSRLEEVTKALMDKKQDIDSELESLYTTRSKIAEQLEEQRHALEEVKFRNTLGEFSEDEYQKSARERQDMIAKFETAMNGVTTNISRYESIFHEEAELLGVEAATPDMETAASEEAGEEEAPAAEERVETGDAEASPAHDEQQLETDEEGYILNEAEGPDYFSQVETTGETSEAAEAPEEAESQSEESETMRADEAEQEEPQRVLPRARVVIISGDQAGAAYPLKDTVTMGRADSNTIVLKDAKTSRQHAQIQQQGNEFIVVDLNSSNGTYVNGQKIEEHVLQNNDEIQIGDYILQFQE